MKTIFGDTIERLKNHPKNVFSVTRGLKGYQVRNKIFTATRSGYFKANEYAIKCFRKYGSGSIHYLY